MINDNGGNIFQRWKLLMKSLGALQQSQKTERVQAGSRVGLRELLLRIRWREPLLEFAGGNDGLNRGYAVRSIDGKILLHALREEYRSLTRQMQNLSKLDLLTGC
jgi:hypothetical protein